MTEPFKDRPSNLLMIKNVAKGEYKSIGIIVAAGFLVLGAIGFLVRQYDLAQIKSTEEISDSTFNEKVRQVFDVAIGPVVIELNNEKRERDSLKQVVGMMQRDLGLYYAPIKLKTKQLRTDTAKLFEQKSLEKK